MRRGVMFFAGFFCSVALAAAADQAVFRIELRAGNSLWAKERPVANGPMLLFKRYPEGTLMGLKAAEVRRIVAVSRVASAGAARGLRPGERLVLGATGGSGGAPPGAAVGAAVPEAGTRPGEREGGTALFNPDRDYRPDWDSKQVPGLSLPHPAASGDYKEGLTLSYPPASAAQSAPGQPPMMPPGSGEPPR